MKRSNFRDFMLIHALSSDLSPTEIEKLRQLYVKVYGEKTGISTLITAFQNSNIKPWKWKFAFEGRKSTEIALAYNNQELVGSTAILPHKAKIDNRIVYMGQGLDSMVSPEYQRQGLFSAMSKFLYKELSEDIVILYAYPNKNNIEPRKKLGWTPLFKIPWYEKTISKGKLNKDITTVTSFNQEFDNLWDSASKNINSSIVRDKKYLDWRFNKNPLGSYKNLVATKNNEIDGYIIP